MSLVSRRAVIVLGFHRSGTSMLMRLLNLLGVDLGPEEDLLAAVDGDNPRGYWEPRWINELNDEILALHGGTYDRPPRLTGEWWSAPALEPLRDKAAAELDRAFGDAPVWGFKDPRTCLTLPFWRPLIEARSDDVRYVHCLRSPAETAASMLRRDIYPDTDAAFWGRSWLEHTARALEATAAEPRRLVFYDDLLARTAAEASSLASFLDLRWPVGPAADELAAVVESGLRHHARSLQDTAGDGALPATVRAVYVSLRAARDVRVSRGGVSDVADALEVTALALWREASAPPRAAGVQLVEAIGEIQHGDVEIERLRSEAQAQREQVRRLAADAAEARAALVLPR
jgi:hypothetical protein